MSRILDALAKAQQGGASPEGRVRAVGGARSRERVGRRERLGTAERGAFDLPVVRQLPDRSLTIARFTPEALAVLARSYESVERCCAMDRGLVLGPEAGPARVLLVGSRKLEGRTAAGALALAATLAEKTRSRVVLADADPAGALAALCLTEPGAPGLRELGAGAGELEACVRRTQLADLYVVPAGSASTGGESTDGAGLGQALETLGAYFPFVVLHAGAVEPSGDGAGASAILALADAVLLTAPQPEAEAQTGRGLPLARNVPVRFLSEFAHEPA